MAAGSNILTAVPGEKLAAMGFPLFQEELLHRTEGHIRGTQIHSTDIAPGGVFNTFVCGTAAQDIPASRFVIPCSAVGLHLSYFQIP